MSQMASNALSATLAYWELKMCSPIHQKEKNRFMT